MGGKTRLGDGLDSLLSTVADVTAKGRFGMQELSLSRIELNPKQPRQGLDEEALEGLAESIRNSGVIQPILVRPRGNLFELVVGERRLRAARLAGLETVPAVVREVEDDEMLELALLENIQREDLNPIEKARAIGHMIEELQITQEECAQRLGLSRPAVANSLRLLNLPGEVQEMVSRGTISAGHAKALLSIHDGMLLLKMAEKAACSGMSVRQTERLAARVNGRSDPAGGLKSDSPHVVSLGEELEKFGCEVRIHTKGQKGRIIIHFNGYDDFERVYERLTGSPPPVL